MLITNLIDFTREAPKLERMNTSSQSESVFAAELLSAAGSVLRESLQGALEKLFGAIEERSDKSPYCAIVTRRDETPTAGQAWRSCVSAWDRVGVFLENTPGEALRKTHWMSELSWPEDLRPVFPNRHESVHGKASNVVRLYTEHSHPRVSSPLEDVFLLFTPGKFKEMLPARLRGVRLDECVLIQVIGYASSESAHVHTESALRRAVQPGTIETLVRLRADGDDPPTDASTLAWRQGFLKHVKCLTATQIAEEGGYQAKNKSAPATRLTDEGKIFSVRQGGQLLYPAFQFRHGQPLPVIARILQTLGKDPTGWDHAFFFATPNAYLDDAKPMEKVRDKKMEEELVRLAELHSHPADVF